MLCRCFGVASSPWPEVIWCPRCRARVECCATARPCMAEGVAGVSPDEAHKEDFWGRNALASGVGRVSSAMTAIGGQHRGQMSMECMVSFPAPAREREPSRDGGMRPIGRYRAHARWPGRLRRGTGSPEFYPRHGAGTQQTLCAWCLVRLLQHHQCAVRHRWKPSCSLHELAQPWAAIDALDLLVYQQDSSTGQATDQYRLADAQTPYPTLRAREFNYEQSSRGLELVAQSRNQWGDIAHWQVFGIDLTRHDYQGLRTGAQIT